MAEIRDVLAYLCKNYPYPEELSKARTTKMVYLADWRSSIDYGRQITNITWEFNHYGPYVETVIKTAQHDHAFLVTPTINAYGSPKEVVSLAEDFDPSLSSEEQNVLNHVIAATSPKNWSDFIRLVYSTYPIVTQPRYSKLDLINLAQRYKKEKTTLLGK